MGKIRFSNNTPVAILKAELVHAYADDAVLKLEETPSIWDNFTQEQAEKLLNPTVEYITVPAAPEYIEVEKIVYVDKPVEVIKYVDREIIKEVPVEVIKEVEVVRLLESIPLPPEIIEKEVLVENKLNKYMVAVIVVLGAIVILQGLL